MAMRSFSQDNDEVITAGYQIYHTMQSWSWCSDWD